MQASSTGPRRESASAIHSKATPSILPIGALPEIEATLTNLAGTDQRTVAGGKGRTAAATANAGATLWKMRPPTTTAATNSAALFAGNEGFNAYGNGNLLVNSVDWASEQENLINITPNTPKERTFIPPTQLRLLLILLLSVIIIPGVVIFAGVSTWLARRRQG